MVQVAERAGVSRALVSLVMRDQPGASPSTRRKVMAAAEELGYRPNLSARNLARGRSDAIGLLLNDFGNPFFAEVAASVAETARGHGLRVLVNSGWGSQDAEREAIDAFVNLGTDGLVLGAPRLDAAAQLDAARRRPVVSINTYGFPDGLDTVSNDERHGARLVVDHLVRLGHRRIAHIGAESASAGPERCDAFTAVMGEHGLDPIVVPGDFTERAGRDATSELMSRREPPTAILATNDLAAVGVLGRLADLGLDVPDDVSVVGYDDTMLAGIHQIALTTVHQPCRLMGRRALELLRGRIDGRLDTIHERIQPRLVVRRTTGPAPSARPHHIRVDREELR